MWRYEKYFSSLQDAQTLTSGTSVTVSGKIPFPDLEVFISVLPMLNINVTMCNLGEGGRLFFHMERKHTETPEGSPKPGSHQKAQRAGNRLPLDPPQLCGLVNL